MRTIGLLVAVSLSVVGLAWAAGGPGDEQDVLKARSAEFAAAWNKHDAAAMAALWAPDGDVINPFGRVAKGRAEVEALFKDEHGGPMKMTTYSSKVTGVRVLGDRVAVLDWEANITGMQSGDGSPLPPFPHHVVVVVQKDKDGKWMVEAARPYAFAPAPPGMGKTPATPQ